MEMEAALMQVNERDVQRAAELFRSLGDEERLRLVLLLANGEKTVGDIAESLGDAVPTVSQRLKVLRYAGIVRSRRDGRHMYYALDDDHIDQLIRNAIEHANHSSPNDS